MSGSRPVSIRRQTLAALSTGDFVEGIALDPDSAPAHVISVVHGIRDRGFWIHEWQALCDRSWTTIRIAPISYGWLGIVPFILFPVSAARSGLIERRMRDVLTAYPEARHTIMAHSNGSKIVSEVLDRFAGAYRTVIFLGSIAPASAADRFPRDRSVIVNDCSRSDPWPVRAEAINPRQFGATGTFGFCHDRVRDRFLPLDHLGYLTVDYFEHFVLPLVFSMKLVLGASPGRPERNDRVAAVRRDMVLGALLVVCLGLGAVVTAWLV